MMKLALAVLLALPLLADQGFLTELSGTRRKAEWTLDSTLQTSGRIRVEVRLTNIVCPSANGDYYLTGFGDYTSVFPWFGVGLYVNSGTCSVAAWDVRDTMNGGESRATIPLNGRTDIKIRYQRDPIGGAFVADATPRVLFQVWASSDASDKVTFNQSSNPSIISVVGGGAANLIGPFRIGDGWTAWPSGSQATIAWAKIHSTVLGPSADAPKACDTADWMNYQLEGNGTDTSGAGRNLTVTNGSWPVTENITTAAPRTFGAPFWTNAVSMRAGRTNQLDGSTSYSDELTCGMTYEWAQANASADPSVLSWSSRTAAQPAIEGTVFGTYTVRLTVTSPAGRVNFADLQVGAVAKDANNLVIDADASTRTVVGQQVAFGNSAWPYLDNRNKVLADYYGGLLSTRYLPVWRTLLSGTLSVSNGSTSVTGVGTNFSGELDCQSSRDLGDFIAIRYADAAVQGGWRYRAAKAKVCTTTSISLEFAWDGPTVSGASFGKFPQSTDFGYWMGAGDNANYYDNVMAHYALYRRSGLTAYRDYARELADRWMESPIRDYYGSNGAGGYWFGDAPRVRALHGVMLRAVDGRSDFWDQIYNNVFVGRNDINEWPTLLNPAPWFGNRDPRESSYSMAQMAIFADLNPSGVRSAALRTAVDRFITNMWVPLISANGGQKNYFTDRVLGQATFTNGSTAVTSSGAFPASSCSFAAVVGRNTRIWAMATGAGAIWENPSNDATSYECTYNNSSSLTLSTPYAGTSGTKWFTLEGINGPAIQPFMQGIVGRGMYYANQSTGNASALTQLQSITDYLINTSYRPSVSAINYITSARDSDCLEVPTNVFCVIDEAGSDAFARDFQAEIMGGLADSLKVNPSQPTKLAIGDILQGALYGAAGYGGPETSNGYFSQTLSLPTARQGKYYGFFFGYGGGTTWDAARLGGVAPVDTRTVRLSYTAPGGTSATSATYVAPSGESSTVSCSGGGCDLPTDWRQGNYLYRLTHTVTGGTVAGDLEPLKVQ